MTSGTGCKLTEGKVNKAKKILKGFCLPQAENVENANVVIYFTCQFTNQKEGQTINDVRILSCKGKTVLLSGCLQKVILDSVKDLKNVIIVQESELESYLDKNYDHGINNLITETDCNIITIGDGCYGRCAYCSIPFGRPNNGRYVAKPIDEIITEIGEINKNTVYLAALDVSAYNFKEYRLPELLKHIWEVYPGIEIQLGNLNITFVKNWTDNDLEILAQVKGNINLPIQSANNRIIEYMNRFYTVDDFGRLYKRLTSMGASVITDMICGYPSETLEEHKKNCEFFKEFPMPFAQIFKFDPKRGTPAAESPEQIALDIQIQRTCEVIASYAIKNPGGDVNTNLELQLL
jgi:tRNA A37 methylthiotransferase MiaB